jgi:hypothetical protein
MEKFATPLERYEYNIDESNILRIWDKDCLLDNDAPNLYQDVDTETGEPFVDRDTVVAWFNNWVKAMEDSEIAGQKLLEEEAAAQALEEAAQATE